MSSVPARCADGFALAYGLLRFIEGDVLFDGVLMLVGGLLFTVAASGGWANFIEGLSNFLWGVGRKAFAGTA